MKKILFSIILIICFCVTGCSSIRYITSISKIYYVEKYEIHDIGVEIWGISEEGEPKGFFVQDECIYQGYDLSSRVITKCNVYSNTSWKKQTYEEETEVYLYLEETDYKEYIKEKYNID